MTLYTGTSGFHYAWWFTQKEKQNVYYPVGISKAKALKYYAQDFNFCELNAPFYRLPSEKTVKAWYDSTPDNFRFLVKFSRYATHAKKLADFDHYYHEFWDNRVEHLKEKCLGILVQLGPNFHKTPENLKRIRQAGQTATVRIYVEFRHPSWFCDEVYDLLREIGWVLVHVNLNNSGEAFGKMESGFSPSTFVMTVPGHCMFRCHGTWSKGYMGGYSQEDLLRMYSYAKEHSQSIIVFDNTDSLEGQAGFFGFGLPFAIKLEFIKKQRLLPHAVLNAMQMKELSEDKYTEELWMDSN
jgi:uncharacterized protein YecE (DUF72 family)